MKNNISRVFLIGVDLLSIFISISLAYGLRVLFEDRIGFTVLGECTDYSTKIIIYTLVIVTLFSEKVYKYRYDFWEETRLVIRGVFISLVLVFSILALTKTMDEYSRFIIVLSFLLMMFVIPLLKNLTKKLLFRSGLWKRPAEILGNDTYIKEEVFGNPYLGYIHAEHANAETTFIDTFGITAEELQMKLDSCLKEKKEVLFLPLLQSFNLSNARIIELSNARRNLVVLENALTKKSNVLIKKMSDVVLSILLFPFLVLLFLLIVFLMKREEPKGSIFFKQKRIGLNEKEFMCYKFRSMYENSDKVLETYLNEHPHEIECYDKYHKYKNDPRITKIGSIMRKTSLDELPQVINVLRGEMSLIGPRPYMPNEKEKIGERIDMVLAVKPGITGLWQVSGRSDVDFHERVDIDVWYTRNWNLWLDVVILVKTIKVVLFRDGAS